MKGIERDGLIALGVGAGIALVSLIVPIVGYIFGYLGVLVHEMGHALGGWIHGYPSIPAFDFSYGGGWTTWQHRSTFIRVIVWALVAAGLWMLRGNRRALATASVAALVFVILDLTRWHQAGNLYLGHGAELAIGMLFFYRALSGVSVVNPLERPLYAGLGIFLVLANVKLAFGLATSWYQRELYAQAKGGGHVMDFSRLANEHLGVPLEAVAMLHLVVSLAALPLTFLVFLKREQIARALQRHFGQSPLSTPERFG